MFDWNDPRFFLAVAKAGSTLAAAKVLGVNQSTVQRRLADLEAQLGQRLVERLPSGNQLTQLGTVILPQAQAVTAAADGFEQSLRDPGRAHIAMIRLTCPEPIALRPTQSGILDRFHAKNPAGRQSLCSATNMPIWPRAGPMLRCGQAIATTASWWAARSRTRFGRSRPATNTSNGTARRPPSLILPAIRSSRSKKA